MKTSNTNTDPTKFVPSPEQFAEFAARTGTSVGPFYSSHNPWGTGGYVGDSQRRKIAAVHEQTDNVGRAEYEANQKLFASAPALAIEVEALREQNGRLRELLNSAANRLQCVPHLDDPDCFACRLKAEIRSALTTPAPEDDAKKGLVEALTRIAEMDASSFLHSAEGLKDIARAALSKAGQA